MKWRGPSYFCSFLWRPRQLPAFSGEKQIGTVTQSQGEGTQIDAVDQNRSGAVAGGAAVGNDGAKVETGLSLVKGAFHRRQLPLFRTNSKFIR